MSIKNVVEGSKSIFKSRTFWLAILQSAIALIGVWQGFMPTWASNLLIVKSLLDIILRAISTKPVTF